MAQQNLLLQGIVHLPAAGGVYGDNSANGSNCRAMEMFGFLIWISADIPRSPYGHVHVQLQAQHRLSTTEARDQSYIAVSLTQHLEAILVLISTRRLRHDTNPVLCAALSCLHYNPAVGQECIG